MLKIALLGGGGHSRANHLPALQKYAATHPGEIELTAFCDLNRATAEQISRQFGFARAYTDLAEMLATEVLDGCIAVTPVHVTARVATTILSAGLPLLMEKPPGATPEECAQVCDVVAARGSRVMVSMNRRFDPAITAARAWVGDRPLRHLRASMLRHERTEPGFITDTTIHCVDAVRSIGGEISSHSVHGRLVDGVWWYHVDLEFESGATGTIDIAPSCGCTAESYEMIGTGYRAVARIAEFDDGTFDAWEGNRLVRQENPTAGQPDFVRNGAYAETEAFVAGLRDRTPLRPTPADVRPSVDLCHAIRKAVQGTPSRG